MRNWIRQRLRNFLYDEESKPSHIGTLRAHSGIDEDANDPIRFTLYNANGGKILETRIYDKRTDRWSSSLHVIENNENFGDSIGRIIFTEMLKKG
jgi:hypothetical protein